MKIKLSIPEIEKGYMKENIPAFRTGDTVRVHTKVKEGNRERIQMFEGIVIHRKNSGLKETFTVRKVSFGIGVERIFPLHSPLVEKIEVIRSGKVKKSRIFYMRDRSGKKSRLKEREDYKNGDKQIASAE